MAGLYSQQGMEAMVNAPVSDLDAAAQLVIQLEVYSLDNNGLPLELAFQPGTVLLEHCEVGNKTEVVSRVDSDVEEKALALKLSALVVQAGWWAPAG